MAIPAGSRYPPPVSQWLSQLDETLRRRALFPDGQPILVAVSGGLDSMVLLRALSELAPGHAWRLTVAHFDHRLRGRSSTADARFVSRAAGALGLPCVTGRADVRRLARAGRLSLEMAARRARHEFLARTARRLRAPTVALAHHADDQLELFFLRLLRGSGGEGLAGMKWRSPSPCDPQVALARPFLDQPKTALRRWAAAKKIPFREDASNARLDIRRNRIRLRLLPLLRRQYQPALRRTILRVMDILGEEADLAGRQAQEWLARCPPAARARAARKAGRPPSPPFANLPVAVQRRCVQLQLLALGIEPDYDLVERLRTAPGRPVSAKPFPPAQLPRAAKLPPAGALVSRDSQGMLRLSAPAPTLFNPENLKLDLSKPSNQALFAGVRLRWRLAPAGRKPRLGQPGFEYFDTDRVGTPVLLRHWRPGDRFQPIGLPAPAKLQNLFTNAKVPRARRHALVVAATARGELFWVEGLRIGQRFKLRQTTKHFLQLSWKRFSY